MMMKQGGWGDYTFVNAVIALKGNKGITTDIVPYTGLNFEIRASLPTAQWNVKPSYDYIVFGCDINWMNFAYSFGFSNKYSLKFLGLFFHMGKSTVEKPSFTSYCPESDTYHVYKYEGGDCYIDGNIMLTGNSFTHLGNIPIRIFGLNRNNINYYGTQPGVKIDYLRLYDSGGDKYIFRAAIRNSDGIAGLYETINDKFYIDNNPAALGYE